MCDKTSIIYNIEHNKFVVNFYLSLCENFVATSTNFHQQDRSIITCKCTIFISEKLHTLEEILIHYFIDFKKRLLKSQWIGLQMWYGVKAFTTHNTCKAPSKRIICNFSIEEGFMLYGWRLEFIHHLAFHQIFFCSNQSNKK